MNNEVKNLIERSFKRKELTGKDVYDVKLRKVGTVSDLALILGNKAIPFEGIAEIGDVILLRDEFISEISSAALTGSGEEFPVESGKICSFCGFENSYLAQDLCQNCGASLQNATRRLVGQPTKRNCPQCGRETESRYRFCETCGYRF
jgi:sporulation protein YlmC with PRC-barrel domain